MLDSQYCSEDIDFTTLSAKNIHDMALLTTAFVDGKSVVGFKPHLPMIFAMDIGTLKFVLYVKEDESQSGAYHIYNALDFDRSLVVSPGDPNIERYEVPAAVLFKDSDFVCVSNIKFNSILPSFKAYAANEYIYGVANDVMLRMISAYDQTSGLRKKQLYETALSFADWLCTMPSEVWDKRIAILNRYQILKRSPGLNADQRAELYKIIDESNDRNDIKVAAYLLLDQHEQAAFYFAKMAPSEQCDFRKYPIFYFWKQNVISS